MKCILYLYLSNIQVLSNSVTTALRLTGGAEVCETARFIEMMDKCFDCLNVSDFSSARHSRNPFKAPYYSSSDFRLKVKIGLFFFCSAFQIYHVLHACIVAGRYLPSVS